MTDKELRKLSRSDLLEILLAQSKEISEYKKEIKELSAQLEDRRIKYSSAGTLAEAAINISGILEAAQKAANIYLDNIKNGNSDIEAQQKKCAQLEAESRKMAKELLDKTAAECKAMREEAEKACSELKKQSEGTINA